MVSYGYGEVLLPGMFAWSPIAIHNGVIAEKERYNHILLGKSIEQENV